MAPSVRKVLIFATSALLATAGVTAATMATPALAASPAFPAHYSAPYLQIEGSDAGDMAADMSASGDE
ncbi:MAG TPA: hypothetical protein VMU95_12310 [Trebonia sp.]|nr:hypothetical protein [Trebonia sp.]